ncbi:MAG: 50S ribosomal protein L23 [Planctomycetes bacterium]|nr:50S ribosomal protein L23 [Planctomycetota bacterium]
MLTAIDIIKRPLITEKSTWEGTDRNRYSFVVHPSADKEQIKAAIAELYNVRVEKVRTQVRKGKSFRTRYGESNTGKWKKALVTLHPEDKIDLF